MEIDFESPNKFRLVHDATVQVSEERMILTSELIHRCLHRPSDKLAWSEFVRRFTPTIRASIEKSFQLKETEGETIQYQEEMIEAVIQMVYLKLTDNRCKALQQFAVARINSIKPYLMMVSINAVREYLRSNR
jgi:hypothetical protein